MVAASWVIMVKLPIFSGRSWQNSSDDDGTWKEILAKKNIKKAQYRQFLKKQKQSFKGIFSFIYTDIKAVLYGTKYHIITVLWEFLSHEMYCHSIVSYSMILLFISFYLSLHFKILSLKNKKKTKLKCLFLNENTLNTYGQLFHWYRREENRTHHVT